ncbi:hypothetical protein ACRCUN_06455 [Mycobacterium sp. LTG2003]
METSLPSAKFGLRVTDGELRFWTGAPCPGTTGVTLGFSNPQTDDATLELSTPSYDEGLMPGVEFEHLNLDGPYPGFSVKQPLPPGFDWHTAQRLDLLVYGPPHSQGSGIDFAPIAAEISEHSAEHPEDTYYFPDIGWLSPAEVAAKDGKEFMTVCTPDPARDEAVAATVGVRVTDGTLRFWTGTPCPFDSGVVLTFQPGQVETTLKNTKLDPDFEHLNLGEPAPQFTVTRPLPNDFDWRTAKSVLFRLIKTDAATNRANQLVWSKTTELATPIAESAQHPADTYYFEGHGWLSPAEIAAEDGTSIQTICGK